jgi:hypothetical protein
MQPPPPPVIGHAVIPVEDIPSYRYAEPADGPAERMERLAASGYPGATTPEEEHLVQVWVMTGQVNGRRRPSFRPAR